MLIAELRKERNEDLATQSSFFREIRRRRGLALSGYPYLQEHGRLVTADMTDECGHQLPNLLQYPGLNRKEIVEAVENFYGRYYFRPKVVFRILRRAIFDGRECRRLFTEAKEFFQLRAKRKDFVDPQATSRLMPS